MPLTQDNDNIIDAAYPPPVSPALSRANDAATISGNLAMKRDRSNRVINGFGVAKYATNNAPVAGPRIWKANLASNFAHILNFSDKRHSGEVDSPPWAVFCTQWSLHAACPHTSCQRPSSPTRVLNSENPITQQMAATAD